MKILIAAGGTAGHINPALAIAKKIQQRHPEAEIHFAGRKKGMEYRLVTKAGYVFHHIEVNGIQRSFTPKNIARNVAAVWHLTLSMPKAAAMLRTLKPDLVIGTGGYVSGPVVRAAAKKGIPTAIHEQNAFPGVTNKILAKEVNLVFAASQKAAEKLAVPQKTFVVGNPVRPEVFLQDRQQQRNRLGVGNRVCILSFGGSLGARRINEAMADLAQWHTKNRDFYHIHATGSRGVELFAELAKEKGFSGSSHIQVQEYIQDMPQLLAAADLVICRAGALTLAELEAAGKAAVLIPSPNVAENHQYYNALELEQAGAAVVIEEKDLTAQKLIEVVDRLTQNPEQLEQMGRNAKTLAKPDSLDLIADKLEQYLDS